MAYDWKKIKAEYIRGGVSYRKLAEKYSVSFSVLRKRAASEKWTDLRNKKGTKRDTEIVDIFASQEAKKTVTLSSIAEKLAKTIDEGIESGKFIQLPQDIRYIASALRDLKELRGEKLQREAEEQLARIEKLRKEAKAEEESKDIRVIISDDLQEYSQ